MSNKVIYKSMIAFHPGYHVADMMEGMGLSQKELAKRLDVQEKVVSTLINGKSNLSRGLATKLAQMTGTSLMMWLNFQSRFEEISYQIEREKKLDSEKKILTLLDTRYFEKLGFLKKGLDVREKISALCKFFKVSDLVILSERDLLMSCRTPNTNIKQGNIVNANAWVQTGVNIAHATDCVQYNEMRLKQTIDEIRELTTNDPASVFVTLQNKLSDCGVVLIALPYLKNSCLNGVVKWLSKDKVLLMINDKGKNASSFWFTLFHELKHVLQGRIKETYLATAIKGDEAILSLGRNNANDERDADCFAQNKLIPKKPYADFIKGNDFTKAKIIEFAKVIKTSPCVIVGRLQHDGLLGWNMYHDLITPYQIA